MRLEQLEQFVEIVDCGSISQAAERLFLSPSTLASSIKNLERELGYDLLLRSNKGIKITPAGTNAYDQAKKICMEVAALKQDDLVPKSREYLRVLSNYSVRVDRAFFKTYAKCSSNSGAVMRLSDCCFLQAVSEISLGLSQLAIVTLYPFVAHTQLRLLEKHHLEYQKLVDMEMFVLIGPQNPFYHTDSDSISLNGLLKFDFVTYIEEDTNPLWREFSINSQYRNRKIFVNSSDTLMTFIQQTQAYTIEPFYANLREPRLYFRQLRLLRIRDTDTRCEYGIVRPAGALSSSLERIFLNQLQEEFQAAWKNSVPPAQS